MLAVLEQVRGQEMEFQRLHRIIGVRFTPDQPESVKEIVSSSMNNEARNSSLVRYSQMQASQIEALEEENRRLEADAERCTMQQTASTANQETASAAANRLAQQSEVLASSLESYETVLKRLCNPVEVIFDKLGSAKLNDDDGGMLKLQGMRPDTLTDHLRLIDEAVKDLRSKVVWMANSRERLIEKLPAPDRDLAASEPLLPAVLLDFVRPKEEDPRQSLNETHKELEAQATKQAQRRELMEAEQQSQEEMPLVR